MKQETPSVVVLEQENEGTDTRITDDDALPFTEPTEGLRRRLEDERVVSAVVDELTAEGLAKVTLSGHTTPCEASSLLRFPTRDAAAQALLGRTVLVLLPSDGRPVILGPVNERLWDDDDTAPSQEAQAALPTSDPLSVQLDNKDRLNLEASQEIRLTCGKSSLVLRRDGTVVVRGVKLISRALQTNKIRGATVSIN